MRSLLIVIFTLILVKGCCIETQAQCSKNCKDCKKKETVQNMKKTENNKSLSCKLTSPELRNRKEEVLAKLKGQVLEKKELSNGYSYKFNGADMTLDMLTDFIKSERQCCDFFDFKLDINNDSFIWLEISGKKGVKQFIETELEM